MKCQDLEKYIYNYCDQELDKNMGALLENHIKNCSACSHTYRLIKRENEILRDLPEDTPSSPDFTPRVMQKIRDKNRMYRHGTPPWRKRIKHYARNTQLLAGAILLFLLFPGLIYASKLDILPFSDSTPPAQQQAAREEATAPGGGGDENVTGNKTPVDEQKMTATGFEGVVADESSLDDQISPITAEEDKPVPAEQADKAIPTDKSRLHVEPMPPLPQTPDKYRLMEKTTAEDADETVLLYEEKTSASEFTVSIKPSMPRVAAVGSGVRRVENAQISAPDESSPEKTASEKKTPEKKTPEADAPETARAEITMMSAPEVPPASTYDWEIVYQEKEYTVTIESTMPRDRLEEIARDMDFPAE